MIVGEIVEVILAKADGIDDFGEPILVEQPPQKVEVIVDPSSSRDSASGAEIDEAGRDQNADIIFTLHFPKTWYESLKDAHVVVRGIKCRVIGDPQAYTPENTPGRYNLPVRVRVVHG